MSKALFLDRDGVVNIEKNYLYKKEDFVFVDGIFELCRHYRDLGFMIFIVTNQSGIARGYYSVEDFNRLTCWMSEEFQKSGIEIKKVYFCPHFPEISGECECRKPKSGMLFLAKKEFGVDLKSSILVGDKESDMEAALGAGVAKCYLFDENHQVKESKALKIVSNFKEIYLVNTK